MRGVNSDKKEKDKSKVLAGVKGRRKGRSYSAKSLHSFGEEGKRHGE